MSDDRADIVLRRYETAANNRGNFESVWEQIAQRALPQYSQTFTSRSAIPNTIAPGQQRTEEMVDATAALALPKFAAAMESMLTPRNQTWHRLQPVDKTLLRNRASSMWFDDANDALFRYRYAPRANFASQMHECYMGLGAFGTSCMFVDALRGTEKGIRYRTIHLGEVYFLENHQGIVDTAFRRFTFTARQAAQRFPDSLPEEIAKAAADPTKSDKPFIFIHCVYPRSEADGGYDPKRMDVKGMQYASEYVSLTGRKLVSEGGYHTFPYPIGRYVVAPGELYGRSPAMLALPSIKVLNEQKKTVLKQGHRAIDPVLLAHDDGVVDGFSLRPGSINMGGVTADGRPLVHALPVGNLALAKEMMEAERLVINDAFLVTLFQILVETPTMTATEVLERAREKGAMLSPTMGRQQSEFLGPLIERELDVLASQNLLPPMPPLLKAAQAEYKTVYDSPLSRAQRAEEASGLMQLVNWAGSVIAITQDPSILDAIDFDAAIPELADIQAVPARWVKDPAMVAMIRQSRAQQAQMKQAVEAAPAMAGVAKALPTLQLHGANAAPQ